MPTWQYNDGAVPFGSRTEDIKRGGTGSPTTVGTYVCESISITRPSKVTERPNEIGAPNGWFAIGGFPHGTATIQIPTSDASFPQIGDWFVDDFGDGEEHWVIVDKTQPFGMNDYWKQNITIRKSDNPPA